MTFLHYPYSKGDLLETPLKYTYTPFQGESFLAAWRAARAEIREGLGLAWPAQVATEPSVQPEGSSIETINLLEFLTTPGNDSTLVRRWLRWMIQRFEVSKRVHSAYRFSGASFKGNGDYRDMDLYLRFGEVLVKTVEEDGCLPALNALLKCLDTLCSKHEKLSATQKSRLAWLLESEMRLVGVEATRNRPAGAAAKVDSPAQPKGDLGVFPRVAFLAADTLRSRGYAQALVEHGARLARVVIVKVPGNTQRLGQSDAVPPSDGSLSAYFIPDLNIPLEQTCKALSEDVVILETGTINAPEVVAALPPGDFDLTVFSGFGGELVDLEVLQGCSQLLHMHAGWLPDYRGSTTVFYSWLREGTCGVSAIRLSANIDEGDILACKRYPPPPPGMDSDYLHDAVLRSDLLLSVMVQLVRSGSLPQGLSQNSDAGETYYIIHPVLKHLAILSGKDG